MPKLRIKPLPAFPPDAVYDEMDSPVGQLTLIASNAGLHAVLWDAGYEVSITKAPSHPVLLKTKQQLDEYFQGTRQQFDLPLVFSGTNFQQQAWQVLRTIAYAHTITYGEQAQQLGDKNKARAVGMANGLNLLSIVVPCHRVIGSNGSLTGFAGGLDKKAYLLGLESSYVSK